MDLRLILNPVEPICAPSPPGNAKHMVPKQPEPLEPAVFSKHFSASFGSFPIVLATSGESRPSPQCVKHVHLPQITYHKSAFHYREDLRSAFNGRSGSCISCRRPVTHMWRPSWTGASGKLCNSCGLRYYRRRIRCSNSSCELVPRNVQIALRTNSGIHGSTCPRCNHALTIDKKVETIEH